MSTFGRPAMRPDAQRQASPLPLKMSCTHGTITAMGFPPTPEQQTAIDVFESGDDLVVEAGAGAGKTSTLRAMANTEHGRQRGLYLGFNRRIVEEARSSMPAHVVSATPHSLAWHSGGSRFADRLDHPRQLSADVAAQAGIRGMRAEEEGGRATTLEPGQVAGIVGAAARQFLMSGDPSPRAHHVVLPPEVRRTTDVVSKLMPHVRRVWDDLQDPAGTWPYVHNAYLKQWCLTSPVLRYGYVLFDEAQDAYPAVAALVAAQQAQKVYVGDSAQAIYGFNGAVDAIGSFTGRRCSLTQSFRFGAAIAESANTILASPALAVALRIVGNPALDSEVSDFVVDPDAVLVRTNAGAVEVLLQHPQQRLAVVGGTKDIKAFVWAAGRLRAGRAPEHRDLSCFPTWDAVREYVKEDQAGAELKSMVGLVDRYGVATVVQAAKQTVTEKRAEMVVSTAHRAKGREWDRVQVHSDFPSGWQDDPDEARLMYVVRTRARLALGTGTATPPEPAERPDQEPPEPTPAPEPRGSRRERRRERRNAHN